MTDAPWSELTLGSNIVKAASGVLVVQREKQIHLERGPNDGQLLLSIDVYNEDLALIAKLRRNAWAFNNDERYDITTHPTNLTLTERETGATILGARVLDLNRVDVFQAEFFAAEGTPIGITPTELSIGGVTFSGCELDAQGGSLSIENGGLSIG